MNKDLKLIIFEAMIATIYVVLVYAFQFMSFGNWQFRIAEVLLILVFFNPRHAIGIVIGTLVANLFSTISIVDVLFGTLATIIALIPMILTRKKPLIALIFPVIINAFVIAAMLYYFLDLPYWLSALQVGLGEAAVLYIVGYPIYRLLNQNTYFKEIMEI